MEPRTLVLSPWGDPNRIATWQEAICLIVLGKAIVEESYDVTEHDPATSQHWSIQIPAVVRVTTDVGYNKTSVKFSRSNVIARDRSRCCYCPPHSARKPARELTFDHVLPRSKGGKTTWLNIVMACRSCNRKKGSRTPQQAGMKMHFKPYTPESLPLTQPLLVEVSKIHPLWMKYMQRSAATG